MKVPISWLKDYVDFEDSLEGLSDKLTFSGVEVEGIETIGGDLSGVVVGDVLSVEKHPDADRLSVCKVSDGENEVQVVCGAPNAKAGMKSAFAPVGVTLPNGLKLKKTKIRGVESHGMLCAEDELGLSDDHAGIMELADTWTPGTPLSEVVGPAETVLDLEITPNRPDCLSIIGIARELAALYGTSLKRPPIKLSNDSTKVEDLTRVEVEDVKGCPRYTAQILHGVSVQPSPAWMQRRLKHVGIRPINNVVDITNYVLIETGQPLHAFDQKLLAEGRIVVRRAKKGEPITTLDEATHELSPDTLVIADAEKPVAVAGVMGGLGSEISDETKTVLLESACFEASDVRHASRTLSLSSDSSYRFERGVDIGHVAWAGERAASLLVEHAGATVSLGMIDVYGERKEAHDLVCRYDRVTSLVGVDASHEEVRSVFGALGLTITEGDEHAFTVRVPTFRQDLEREIDLVEEFARIHGLDKIPARAPRSRVIPEADDTPFQARQALRRNLIALGLYETVGYSLVNHALLDRFAELDNKKRVELPNPLSQDQAVLRSSLIPQIVETLGRNIARQNHEVALFETGRTYAPGAKLPDEREHLAIGLVGAVGRTAGSLRPASAEETFLWLKGIWGSLLSAQGFDAQATQLSELKKPYFAPGYAASVSLNGERIGVMGLVSDGVRSAWRMSEPVAVLEVQLAPLTAHFREIKPLEPIAAYPAIVRDVAMVVDRSVKHEDILKIIHEAAPPELEGVKLFDIYEGKNIGENKKSMAYSLTYRSLERTLTDDTANRYHDVVKQALKSNLDVELRES